MPKRNIVEELNNEVEILESVLLDADEECDDCISKGLKAIKEEIERIADSISNPNIKLYQSLGNNTDGAVSQAVVTNAINSKQDALVCGETLKTINGQCLLGSGDIEIIIPPSCPFEIGDVLPSFSSVNPHNRWNETQWELCAKGRAMIGVDPDSADYYESGIEVGEKTHILTAAEMAAHNHGTVYLQGGVYNIPWQDSSTPTKYDGIIYGPYGYQGIRWATSSQRDGKADGFRIDASHTHQTVGANVGHNNVQPSVTLYLWKRIA